MRVNAINVMERVRAADGGRQIAAQVGTHLVGRVAELLVIATERRSKSVSMTRNSASAASAETGGSPMSSTTTRSVLRARWTALATVSSARCRVTNRPSVSMVNHATVSPSSCQVAPDSRQIPQMHCRAALGLRPLPNTRCTPRCGAGCRPAAPARRRSPTPRGHAGRGCPAASPVRVRTRTTTYSMQLFMRIASRIRLFGTSKSRGAIRLLRASNAALSTSPAPSLIEKGRQSGVQRDRERWSATLGCGARTPIPASHRPESACRIEHERRHLQAAPRTGAEVVP